MNLKEAFRYQKFLELRMSDVVGWLSSGQNVTKVIKEHKRHEVFDGANDIIEDVAPIKSISADIMIGIGNDLITEREKVSKAINTAKNKAPIDIDSAIASNKFRQSFKSALRRALSYIPQSTTSKGTAYKFNEQGDQVPYNYDIIVTYSDNYNRDEASRLLKETIKEADKISTDIDSAQINAAVDFEPMFDVNQTIDEIVSERMVS